MNKWYTFFLAVQQALNKIGYLQIKKKIKVDLKNISREIVLNLFKWNVFDTVERKNSEVQKHVMNIRWSHNKRIIYIF